MGIGKKVATHVVLHKFESQLKSAAVRLKTLKLKAEAAKAILEIKAIATLLPKLQTIQHRIHELKTSGADRWEQVRADVEAQIAELDKSIEALESKPKAKAS